ncbi:MAG: nucleoside triphosphate pyrophosphohydrolase [Gemmobacter sp.]|jgi:ATP diphosphatase
MHAPVPSPEDHAAAASLARLLAIMRALRDPRTGCPWDIAQDSASIAPYTLEEAHEVVDAIERAAWDELPAELGDLLLQVVFHARIAQEVGRFAFPDVVAAISAKMIDRHPDIFPPDTAAPETPPPARPADAAARAAAWEAAKARERAATGAGTLDGIARALPALTRAVKLQSRAARVGFDWPATDDVLAKLHEELAELAAARATGDPAAIADEFGDILFVLANLARHLRIDPEAALRGTNAKFTRRFAHIEDALARTGRTPADSTLAEMDTLWNAAKAAERAARAARARGED